MVPKYVYSYVVTPVTISSSYNSKYNRIPTVLFQESSFRPAMFITCCIFLNLWKTLVLCGQTHAFHLRTTMVIYESYSMERTMWIARFVLEACKYNGPFILFCFNHVKIMMVSEDHVSLWTFWKTIARLSNINSLQYFISVCGYI